MHAHWRSLSLLLLLILPACATTALHNPTPIRKGEVMLTGGVDGRGQIDGRMEVGLVHGVGVTGTFGVVPRAVALEPGVDGTRKGEHAAHVGGGLGLSYGKPFSLGGEGLHWKVYGEMEGASGFPHHWGGGETGPLVETFRTRGRALVSGPLLLGAFGTSSPSAPSPYTMYLGAEGVAEGRVHKRFRKAGCQGEEGLERHEVCLEGGVAMKPTNIWLQSLGLVAGGQYWLKPGVLALQGEVTIKGTFLQIEGQLRDDYSVLPTDVFTGSVGLLWTFKPF